ncbi:MAG: single-stranded-DNA-specific exonuclease RecJ [Deltaproteobacteria bacterium]|nr:single-stranded-DNA-specific exonuclease RecJ [Deltaproteobacteria bacterium]
MSFLQKRWTVLPASQDLASELAREIRISPLLSKLLVNRTITEPESAQRFLSSSLQDLRPPFLMKGMTGGCLRIIEAIKRREKICVFGDYDVDGITGTALLKLFLDSLGANVSFYIPNRLTEGYGLNIPALDKFRAQGISLIITVDCGISNAEEVSFARSRGIDVVVTDHHEVPERIPEACAVINPKQKGCEFPFKHLAGVGVAFYLVIALRMMLRDKGFWEGRDYPNLREYLDLVTLGTVADIVPLLEENRIFVKHGLEVLCRSTKPGIIAIRRVGGGDGIPMTSDLIAYRLAPRINAAGRMGSGEKGVILLTTSDQTEADAIASELDRENSKRQQIEETIFKEACGLIESTEGWLRQMAFVLESPAWHPGVIGIGASRIADRYYRPTILISLDGDIGHGSARSIDEFHIYDGLRHCEGLLKRFGGHKAAAGLTIARDNITQLRKKLNSLVENTLSPEDIVPKLRIDTQLDFSGITESFIQEIEALAPFGAGNPEPLFVSDVVSVSGSRMVGKNHLKLWIGGDGTYFDAIGFGMGDALPSLPTQIRVAFVPEINVWQGTKRLQLKMKDIDGIDT